MPDHMPKMANGLALRALSTNIFVLDTGLKRILLVRGRQ